MSQATPPSASPQAPAHAHPANLAHHFDTPQQQFDSGKLGIWLFLLTEILLFSGLFCAYAVYRANHPQIFEYAHLYLNKYLGFVNTLVLIFSSLTMAWAVRAAQLGQQRLLVRLLAITLACGGIFLGIKYVEYKDKWEHGTLWGARYQPHAPPHGASVPGLAPHGSATTSAPASHTPEASAPAATAPSTAPVSTAPTSTATAPAATATAAASTAAAPTTGAATTAAGPATPRTPDGYIAEQTSIAPAAVGPRGLAPAWVDKALPRIVPEWRGPEPRNTQVFFSIYFIMTGLHGLHVIAGMAVISWILIRAIRRDFSPAYFNPVDYTGLYWHLVDLVWIFLFPLLYLIQ